MTDPYPLTFIPILKAKVWGGRRLMRYGKPMPEDAAVLIGESWELADLASTSASGGGGDAAHSVIANGPLTGSTITNAMRLWGPRLLGDVPFQAETRAQQTPHPAFPLLLKFLDAREHLSVQVHPSPHYAAAHPQAHLKTESWYVLDAEPVDGKPPMIFRDLKPGTTREDFILSIESGEVASTLATQPAVPGQCHTLPSGTLHALGAGVLVAEVQTASDTTFRVYDWTSEYNRPQRALHIDAALECIDFSQDHDTLPTQASPGSLTSRLAATAFYTIDEVAPTAAGMIFPSDVCVAIMGIAGRGQISSVGGHWPDLAMSAGTTVLIPAAAAGDARLCDVEHCRVLTIGLGQGN